MGISDLPTWVIRDVGPRVLADSAAGLPAKKLRHRTFSCLHSSKMGLWRGAIRNQGEEFMSACEKVGS
jgi:hypothetical protein